VFELAIQSKTPFVFVVDEKWSQVKHFTQRETWANWTSLPDKHDHTKNLNYVENAFVNR
jgi:hypothetical protein